MVKGQAQPPALSSSRRRDDSVVEPAGRYWVETRNGNAGPPAFVECMNEKMRVAR